MGSTVRLWCSRCDREAAALAWRCEGCREPVDLAPPKSRAAWLDQSRAGLWRYASQLPVDQPLTLGEPITPLLAVDGYGPDLRLKLEGALPTGSFKDRGAAVLVRWLTEHAAKTAVIDSSGNAGAALAAYCAAAGLSCDVYAPSTAAPGKLSQVAAYGATLHRVAGPRQAVADAAMTAAEADPDAVYASHAWSPLFLAGTATFAFEVWEQLGGAAPQAVVVPVGAGTLLLGVAHGFDALRAAGLAAHVPRIYGVQADGCAPLAAADQRGAAEPVDVTVRDTAAEGVRIVRPPRGRQVLHAVRRSEGHILSVSDSALWQAHRTLGALGVYAEPTATLAVAGLDTLLARSWIDDGETVIAAITGTGLKAAAMPDPSKETVDA